MVNWELRIVKCPNGTLTAILGSDLTAPARTTRPISGKHSQLTIQNSQFTIFLRAYKWMVPLLSVAAWLNTILNRKDAKSAKKKTK